MKRVKNIYSPLIGVLSTIILIIGCFINTQVGLVGPLAEIQRKSNSVLYLDYDQIVMRDYMSPFFVRDPAIKINMNSRPNSEEIKEKFNDFPQLEHLAVMSQKEGAELTLAHEKLSKEFNCSRLKFANSISDQLIYSYNPEKNQRRKPTLYFYCSRKQ